MSEKHARMSPAQRAKQFLPFAGVKGLDEALSMKELELEYEESACLSEDRNEELNRVLSSASPGQKLLVEYYNGQRYVTQTSVLLKCDLAQKSLVLDSFSVPFESIRSILPLS